MIKKKKKGGNVMGGLYFFQNANGKWYHFNDTSVSELKILV